MRYIKKISALQILLITLVFAWPTIALADTVASLGKPTGYVNDYTSTLSTSDKARLTSICEELESTNGTELAITIIFSLEGRSVESFAQELFESWEIGKAGADNGVLILVSMNDREWRVQTGYGVEGLLPDSLAGRIMETEAVPAFRNGDYGKGLINATTQIKLALEGEEYSYGGSFNIFGILITAFILGIAGVLIWLSVRIKCPRCGSKAKLTSSKDVLEANYSHSGIRKTDYECTVCHHKFSRMVIIPMLVKAKSTASSSGSSSGWFSGWSSGGSSSSGWSSGGSSFGGFGGGSSGGGGASGGW